MIAVLKHELKLYFNSMTAWVFGAFLLLFIGLGSMLYNLQAAVSNFEFVLEFASMIFVVIVPILTMRVIAEERKHKTDQLLYSLPVSTTDIVLGKYIALIAVYFAPLCFISIYPLIFSQFGEVYLLTAYGTLFAFFIMGAALIALGMFISSLTENQGLAAGIGIAVILFNYFSVSLAEYISSNSFGNMMAIFAVIVILTFTVSNLTKNEIIACIFAAVSMILILVIYFVNPTVFEGLLPDLMSKLSLYDRFYTFVNGAFDITAIVYYITFAVFFLFLSIQSLEKRRYN